jgi:hypothetical protein
LVRAADELAFDILITADQGLNYQQSLMGRKIAVVVLSTNKSSVVLANVAKILTAISAAKPGSFSLVDITTREER